MSQAVPDDLASFLRGLGHELHLAALWLVRRSDLGAIMEDYEPEAEAIELIEKKLFAEHRDLFEFVEQRRAEN